MAYTTHAKIRKRAGFLNYHVNEPFLTSPMGVTISRLYIDKKYNGDKEMIVPGTGSSAATYSDVYVYSGYTALTGMSSTGVSGINADFGYIDVTDGLTSGASVVATYFSSPLETTTVETARVNAESRVNNVLGRKYSVPLTVAVGEVEEIATKLAAGRLLVDNYGPNASPDTATYGQYLIEDAERGLSALVGDGSVLVGDDGSVISQLTTRMEVLATNQYYNDVGDSYRIFSDDITFGSTAV